MESGEFVIEIGESSRDIRLSKSVQVEGTTLLPVIITENSTISQLMAHPKGAAFVQNMMAARAASNADANKQAMGEGSGEMMEYMMREMPLSALVSYGVMSTEQLRGLVAMSNS